MNMPEYICKKKKKKKKEEEEAVLKVYIQMDFYPILSFNFPLFKKQIFFFFFWIGKKNYIKRKLVC